VHTFTTAVTHPQPHITRTNFLRSRWASSASSNSNHAWEYGEYGSESRPRSRRLSVCNSDTSPAIGGPFFPSSSPSHPATSTVLSTSTPALALLNHYLASSTSSLFLEIAASATLPPPPLLQRQLHPASMLVSVSARSILTASARGWRTRSHDSTH
jgi:hypothetical protein